MLFAVDLHKDLVDIEGIAAATVVPLQPPSVLGTKLDAPETYRLSSDGDASFGEEVFDVAMTQIESVVKADSISNDVGWETMSFICAHRLILAQIRDLTWQYPCIYSVTNSTNFAGLLVSTQKCH